MPLSRLTGTPAPKLPTPDIIPYDAQKVRTLDFFNYLNLLIQFQNFGPDEQALLRKFTVIGIAPGKPFDPALLDEPTRRAMEEGLRAGLAKINGPKIGDLKTPRRLVNGWLQPPNAGNSFGGDYLMRAVVFAKGPYGNDKEEARYTRAYVDGGGQPLDAAKHRYVLRLSKEDMSMPKYFWSVTMYDPKEGQLVENPINRYSISNRTPGLKYGADGSLTIVLRHDSPGEDQAGNWLPAPKGPFYLSMRIYGPKGDVLSGKWAPPPVMRVE